MVIFHSDVNVYQWLMWVRQCHNLINHPFGNGLNGVVLIPLIVMLVEWSNVGETMP